jgi:hypothetical protein
MALSRAPGSRFGFAIAADTEKGAVAAVADGRLAATAVPMPTPATSAIPKTVHCSRRDTSLQYALRRIAIHDLGVSPLLSN